MTARTSTRATARTKPCHAPQCRLPERRPNVLICRNFRERMMGLEPTTFCMASASDRSRPFAPVRSNWPFAAVSVGASERKRTRANVEPCHSCHGTQSRLGCQPWPLRRPQPASRRCPRREMEPARTGLRSTFGPVSLAYESELKVVFRWPGQAQGCMSISAAIRCENAIVLQAGRFGEWAEFAHPIPDRAVGLGPEGPLDLLDGAENRTATS
jgi:hypothetical protein